MTKRGVLFGLFLIGLVISILTTSIVVAGKADDMKVGEQVRIGDDVFTKASSDTFGTDDGRSLTVEEVNSFFNIGGARTIGQSFTDTGSLGELFSLDATGNLASWIQAYEKGQGVSVVLIKYLFLVMIIMLVFAAFSYVGFPENAAARMILTVIFSILATILIDPNELVSIVRSYTAAGIALSLIIPIIALGFITFAVAVKVSAIGIVMQRILWAFYSVYLFVSAGGAWLITKTQTSDNFKWVATIFEFLGGSSAAGGAFGDSTIILLIEFVASILIFYFLVLNNEWFINYFIEDIREAKAKKSEDITKKAKIREKQLAGSLEDNK